MEVTKLLAEGRAVWSEKMQPLHIVSAMGVVYGDICRIMRDAHEGSLRDDEELKKELGNMILSTIRWCDDSGFTPEECIEAAMSAQRVYRQHHTGGKTNV